MQTAPEASQGEEPSDFEAMLSKACERVFDQTEALEACQFLKTSGKLQEFIVRLMQSGKSAGRTNVMVLTTASGSRSFVSHQKRPRKRMDTGKSFGVVHGHGHVPFTLSIHAVTRYVERHTNGQTIEEVSARLSEEVKQACPLKKRTINGDEQWVSSAGTLFVVKRDGGGMLPLCVTILPREDQMDARGRGRVRRGKE